jgi:5-methylcytosine-specific restriction endonuclease McrA
MKYDNDRLNSIYDKTDGYCHICQKKLAFTNHGKRGFKGAWHVEHSKSKAKGGSDHMNNLYPACIKCNSEKGTMHTKTARGWNGNTRAPYSAAKKKQIKSDNTTGGALIGGALGAFFGPVGAALGVTIGGAIGSSNSPKK